jgi:lysozyme
MAIEIPRARLPAELIASKECERLVRHFEGFRPVAYRCPAGIWTIGYGFTEGVKPGDTISMADASERLRVELEEHAEIVRSAIPGVPVTQGQFDALVSYVFNIGRILETLLARLQARDYSAALLEFPRACRAEGKPLPGLYRRRLAEACMWSGLPWEGATAPHLVQLVADARGYIDFSKTTTLEQTLERARQDIATTQIRANYPGAPPIIPGPSPAGPPPVEMPKAIEMPKAEDRADELVLTKPAPSSGPVAQVPAAATPAPQPPPPPVATPPVSKPPPPPVIIAPKSVDVRSIPYGEITPENGAKNMSESQRGVGMVLVGVGSVVQIITMRLGVGTAVGAIFFDLSRDPVVIALVATGIVAGIGWLTRRRGTKVMTTGMVNATQVLK